MVFQTIRTLERLGAAPALVGFVVSFPSKRLHFGGRLWMKQAFLLKQKEKNIQAVSTMDCFLYNSSTGVSVKTSLSCLWARDYIGECVEMGRV